MSITESLAIKLGNECKAILNVDEDREQVIVYGAIIVLQTIFAILWTAVAGFLFGVLYEALLFSTIASVLRKYSGGVHASSPGRCIIIGTSISVIFGILINKLSYKFTTTTVFIASVVCIIVSLLIVYKKAPVDSIKKPITNIKMKQRLRRKSIIIIAISASIVGIIFAFNIISPKLIYIKTAECIFLGVLWQSITLTGLGIGILDKVDLGLKYVMESGRREG